MRLFEGTPFDRPPHCEVCGKLQAECTCTPVEKQSKPPGKQTARIAIERRKNGRQVTVVRGLAAADNDLPTLLTQLKTTCGAGGTLKEEELEIQGDQLDRVRERLTGLGYRVKG